jgi:uncharacterized membrane protein
MKGNHKGPKKMMEEKNPSKKKAAITFAIAISVPALTEIVIGFVKVAAAIIREFMR